MIVAIYITTENWTIPLGYLSTRWRLVPHFIEYMYSWNAEQLRMADPAIYYTILSIVAWDHSDLEMLKWICLCRLVASSCPSSGGQSTSSNPSEKRNFKTAEEECISQVEVVTFCMRVWAASKVDRAIQVCSDGDDKRKRKKKKSMPATEVVWHT